MSLGALLVLSDCLLAWMICNSLQLNVNKTKAILVDSQHQLKHIHSHRLHMTDSYLPLNSVVSSLGVLLTVSEELMPNVYFISCFFFFP